MQTLRVEDTDPRLEFGPNGAWTIQGDYHYSETDSSRFFILFRGTGIKIYGQYGNNGSTLLISADGADYVRTSLNGTSNGTKQIWNQTGLADTDHQILGVTTSENGGNRIWIDYIELENAAGTGFDPRTSGTNATEVPQEAVVVDDTDSAIQYSPPYQWESIHEVQYQGANLSRTNLTGTSLTFTFEGVAVWYYSDVGPPHGYLTASIDGLSPQRVSGTTPAPMGLARQRIWSQQGLPPGRHTLTLTQIGEPGQYFTVDFFRVLRNNNSSLSTLSTAPAIVGDVTPSGVTHAAKTSQTRLGIAIGVPLGVILLIGLTAYIMVRRHRRPQTNFMPRFYVPSLSQQVLPRKSTALAAAPSTIPPLPPLVPSTVPRGQSLDAPNLEWETFTLGGVSVPPPYRSPDFTSRY